MSNCKTQILGYIPVLLPHITERDLLIGSFTHGVEELINLINNISIKFQNDFESSLNAILKKDINDFPIYKKIWEGRPSPFYDFWFLEISIALEFSKTDVENYIGDFFNNSFSVKQELYKTIAAGKIEKTLNDLLLALNIAKSGLITTSKGKVLYDNTVMYSDIKGTHNYLFDAKQIADDQGWPETYDLKIETVWNYLTSFVFFNIGFGEGPIGRAIAAMTYLLKNEFKEVVESISLDMIWILIGLEALYGKGSVGSKNQLIEKSRTFLGEPNKNKKSLGKSYDLRSRVIHGDIDIPFSYCPFHGLEKYEKLSSDMEDARFISTAILLSSLQKLVKENKRSLEFKYHII